jgi:hypothetical protein
VSGCAQSLTHLIDAAHCAHNCLELVPGCCPSITIYNISDSTIYHWALVALNFGETLTNGPVQMFRIVTQRDGDTGEDGYMVSHSSRDLLQDESE